MARLLVHVDPTLLRPNGALGDVVSVIADGREWGRLDVIDFAQVDVPGMSVAEAQSIFCEPGVPKDRPGADPRLYPRRARRIDHRLLPAATTTDRIAASRAVIEAHRVDAHAAGTRAGDAAREATGLVLPGEEGLPIGDIAHARFEEATAVGASVEQIEAIDRARDSVDAAVRAAERAVWDPELAKLPRPEVVVWTRAELDAAVVQNG